MKFLDYLKDKMYQFAIVFVFYIFLFLLLKAFKIPMEALITISILYILSYLLIFFIEYFRKKTFYTNLYENTFALEHAYHVLETLEHPEFLEGKILEEILYEINKSMREEVKRIELQTTDFKEYIEMWIHEVKIPISTLILMAHNKEEIFPRNAMEQIKKIESFVEQILYYARSENANKDYFIKKVPLSKIIGEVALKNKDELLTSKVDFLVDNMNHSVYTDSKWLIFIVNQIVNNSIKYRKQDGNSYIKISTMKKGKTVELTILDNGVGIKESDIPRVFYKTFTGYNGRVFASSTGMGLFIAKNLCEKLGHKIKMESKYGEYTKVTITFVKDSYYDVL